MAKKILCLLLAILMLLCVFSCGGPSQGEKKPSGGSTTTATNKNDDTIYYEADELPDDLDFGGNTVTFLTPADSSDGWFSDEITVEELTNEAINDSVYNRERFVEDRLNVEIVNVADNSGYTVRVNTMMNSGDDTYQILSQRALDLSSYVPLGYLCDLYDVSNINLDKPWWSSKFSAEAEVMGHLFLATGSLSLSLKRFLFATFYNKKVAEDNAEKNPELADLYTIVDEGRWTIDKMIELGGNIYIDLNGNSEKDAEDYYGIVMNDRIDLDTMWSTFDINVFSKDSDGWLVLDVDTEKMYSALDIYRNLINHTAGCYDVGGSDSTLLILESMLAGDTMLFGIDRLIAIETETLRNMQHDYGILPTPKYDEKQKEYYTYAHDQYTAFAIPITVADTACAGAVLEAMASYSYRDTEPAYLDLALKGKYMSDMQSRRMIDIVINGFMVDSMWIYTHTYGMEFGSSFRYLISDDNSNYASTYATLQRKIEKTLPVSRHELERALDY